MQKLRYDLLAQELGKPYIKDIRFMYCASVFSLMKAKYGYGDNIVIEATCDAGFSVNYFEINKTNHLNTAKKCEKIECDEIINEKLRPKCHICYENEKRENKFVLNSHNLYNLLSKKDDTHVPCMYANFNNGSAFSMCNAQTEKVSPTGTNSVKTNYCFTHKGKKLQIDEVKSYFLPDQKYKNNNFYVVIYATVIGDEFKSYHRFVLDNFNNLYPGVYCIRCNNTKKEEAPCLFPGCKSGLDDEILTLKSCITWDDLQKKNPVLHDMYFFDTSKDSYEDAIIKSEIVRLDINFLESGQKDPRNLSPKTSTNISAPKNSKKSTFIFEGDINTSFPLAKKK